MLKAKQGWKIRKLDYRIENDGCEEWKDLMIVFDQDEAKNMIAYLVDLDEKRRKDPFCWNRHADENSTRMRVTYVSRETSYGQPRERIEFEANLINLVEEE